jgi:hypothetical protein
MPSPAENPGCTGGDPGEFLHTAIVATEYGVWKGDKRRQEGVTCPPEGLDRKLAILARRASEGIAQNRYASLACASG